MKNIKKELMKYIKIKLLILLECLTFVSYAKPAVVRGDSIKNYNSCILYNGHLAFNTKAIGVKYIGGSSLRSNSNIALGFNLAFEKISFTDNLFMPKKASTNIWFATGGGNVSYKITEGLFFVSELSMVMGKQETSYIITTANVTYTNVPPYTLVKSYTTHEEKEQKTIYGAHIEEHLFYHPKKAKGLIIGTSVFIRFLNAKYYENDFGICAYLGIKI